jgi:trk system potassium uptake protein TrkA
MRIIIVGVGEVGTELAKRLTHENHDVVVIDKDLKKLTKLNESLDVMVVEESARISALEQAGIKHADVLIAVTDTDEINIMSCMIAKKMADVKTVARIRNPEYGSKGLLFSNEQLGIDVMINPEKLMAMEIAKLIKTPMVSEIEYFADGKIEMLVFKVDKDSEIVGKPISTLTQSQDFLIIAILRENGDVVIPGGDDKICPNDHIYVVGKTGALSEIGWMVRSKVKRYRNIMILGGGRIGLKVAKIIEEFKGNGMSVKLIEKCEDRCQEISEALSRTLVLCGDGTDLTFLKEEELEKIDVLVSVTGNDEVNILSAILAKKLGVKKTIIEVSKPDYESVLQALDIDSYVSSRTLVANKLAKLFRKPSVVSVTILKEGKAEMLELIAQEDSPIINQPLVELNLPKGVIIGGIVRNGKAIIPRGGEKIIPMDHVIVFTSPELVEQVEQMFSVVEPYKRFEGVIANEF